METLSAPLAVLMNGSMREAIDGAAPLYDVDEQTFVRFCEYAYMGDYTPAQQQPVLTSSKFDWGGSLTSEASFEASSKKKKKKGSSKLIYFGEDEAHCGQCNRETPTENLWNEFQRRTYSVVSPKFRPREHMAEYEDNAGLFICHARVYVFADTYDIAELCSLSLDKLHQALCSFEIVADQMGKVIDLVRFSYCNDNTRDNEVGQDIDSLRRMVVHFVVCVFMTIVKDDGFLGLMEEGGCFVRDLTGLLGERIIGDAR